LAIDSKDMKMKQIITLCMLITITACSAKNDYIEQPMPQVPATDLEGNPLGILTLQYQGVDYQSKVAFNVLGSDIVFEIETDEEINTENQVSAQEDLDMFDDILNEEESAPEDIGKALRLLSDAQQLAVDKYYPEALAEVEDAIKAAPSLAQSHALKGSVYYKMKNYTGAKIAWEQALELDPTYEDVQKVLARLDTK